MSDAVQTTVDTNPVLGTAGELYDDSPVQDIVTRIAAVDIPFGAYVHFTANGQCTLPGASGDITDGLGGIAIRDSGKPTGGVGYPAGSPVMVLEKGRVWVSTESAVALGSTPYIRYTAATGEPVGGIGGTTDSGKNVQAVNARIWKGNTAAGLAVLEMTT